MSLQAQKRLTREYKNIQKNPPPYITAKPNEDNILEWHYVITGPPDTCYVGGQYHGTLTFQKDYPFKPPAIRMITPSGRFEPNTRLCLSMSDFHPDTWNPAWSVATILTGLLSFMTSEEPTTGSIRTSVEMKKKLAKVSKKWNNASRSFIKNFPELIAENERSIKQEALIEQKKSSILKQDNPKDMVADINKIQDVEERLRAAALNDDQQELESKHSIWMYSFLLVIILAIGAKLSKVQ
ncbi:E2 ubiquitin-conjugating protein [Saccharomycopsis crataegensis]|uniref:Ubiquitin-conjugating enzyme E2 6 n=1 Tax=Saccharomycopsis crataegensis TaxID=43959 RepID=A0AAV5QMF6_9ASCO|nr:E2 ubiquitin-conjugating protein [Saccharomycopsis crataegensis]